MSDDSQRHDELAHFSDFVKWHFDDLTDAYENAGRNSIALIGFDAVVLTLGADHLAQTSGRATWLAFVGTCFFIFALIAAFLAMMPQRVDGVNSAELRNEWIALTQTTSGATFRYPDQSLEHLLHSLNSSSGESPLLRIRRASEIRGRFLAGAMGFSARGAICYGASLLVEIRS